MAGTKDAVVEFDYDGVIPSGASFYDLSNPATHPISIDAIDTDGNVSRVSFRLWEISSQHIATLEGHNGRVNSVVFSPNGKTLASGGTGSTIKLWDVATKQNIATLEGHTGDFNEGAVQAVAFSPDGTTLASGSRDRTIKLWDVATRQNIATLAGHSSYVESVVFSPDGTTLASGSRDGTIKLWDMSSYTKPQTPNPDFNGDGRVDLSDFLLFASQFGLSRGDEQYDAKYDLDEDGTIGFGDFLIFGRSFGNEGS